MLKINDIFRPRNVLVYPPNNNKTFEEYFYDNYISNDFVSERIYIPIFWTNYYISKNYGQGDLTELQKIINSLDRTKKYFTIVQYDDNILNDLGDLDILIFAQGGYGKYKDRSYSIPLNCQTPEFNICQDKNIFASFIGRKTHNIREDLFQEIVNKENYVISENTDYMSFINTMSRSLFSLCPRGYGLTSFRICEALKLGSIPVYVYDEPFIPFEREFDFNDIGITIHHSKIKNLDGILKSKTEKEIDGYLKKGREIYNTFFSYEGCCSNILNILK